MSARTVIDSLEFVRSGQELRGTVAVASLSRLADSLYDTDGSLSFSLAGAHDRRERPQLKLAVRGSLHVQCQRCLGMLDYPLELASTLLLLRAAEIEDDAADSDPLAPDAIAASAELDVWSVIEDEILLALPFAPRHDEGVCRARDTGTQPEARDAAGFAAKLAAWKKA